jgi:hypothetical protein
VIKKLEKIPVDETVSSKCMWELFMQEISYMTKSLFFYSKQYPGFDRLSSRDLVKMLVSNMLVVGGLRVHKLFINDDYYLICENNVQFSRRNMYKIFGVALTNAIFHYHSQLGSLCLSDQEVSLLVPYILTTTSKTHPKFKAH